MSYSESFELVERTYAEQDAANIGGIVEPSRALLVEDEQRWGIVAAGMSGTYEEGTGPVAKQAYQVAAIARGAVDRQRMSSELRRQGGKRPEEAESNFLKLASASLAFSALLRHYGFATGATIGVTHSFEAELPTSLIDYDGTRVRERGAFALLLPPQDLAVLRPGLKVPYLGGERWVYDAKSGVYARVSRSNFVSPQLRDFLQVTTGSKEGAKRALKTHSATVEPYMGVQYLVDQGGIKECLSVKPKDWRGGFPLG